MNVTVGGFIDYEDEDMDPGEEWHATLDSTIRNIKAHFPKIARAEKYCDHDGAGLRLFSDDLETLKHAWTVICTGSEAEYQKLVKNNTLEHEITAMDFYNVLER